ncbi:T9SS type A sorting domain-containing protein [candidate division TA06 bacterium]|uniref:T9SS type A sorting domain-containing protein n=1 Tax=candidate division TA06 bacterium TaxID=2250710 RepID=A0A933I9B5_UNCT6|nr:T9SS type A sorting domain-containing protein [candidate division TA06 bacterium]
MKRILFSAVAGLIFFSSSGFAVWHARSHNAGLLELRVSNYGTFGFQDACYWPKGSGESYIYGAGVWVGAIKGNPQDTASLSADISDVDTTIFLNSTVVLDSSGGAAQIENEIVHYRTKTDTTITGCLRGFAGTLRTSHLQGALLQKKVLHVTVGYNPSNGTTEFVPGDLPNEAGYTNPDERVLFSDDPADTSLWPLRDAGGKPVVRSTQDSYGMLNDQDSARNITPLKIKIEQIGYSWSYHFYEDFVFLTCRIINNAPDSLQHLYLGLACDADIGDYSDDLVSFDSPRNLGYAYDSDSSEWGHKPGYLGFDFLESPLDTNGQQLGLTAFKIMRNPSTPGEGEPDPGNDDQAYQLLSGYNYTSSRYHPFDTISTPTDVRFLQGTGPFDLAGGDTVRVVIAVIAGANLSDLQDNSDLAQNLYDIGFITDYVKVISPNGGEEIGGAFNITWEDSSAIGDTLRVGLAYSRDGGKTYPDIVADTADAHWYPWNTLNVPDGCRYKIRATVHDSICVGEDASDSIFTINNPGVNGVPDVVFLSPQRGNLSGTVPIEWWAKDADHDTLRMAFFLRPVNQANWTAVDTNQINDGFYSWNTYLINNGDYYLKIAAYDAVSSGSDSSVNFISIVNDHGIAAEVTHTAGGCNALAVQALSYEPENFTGHIYEARCNRIQPSAVSGQPLYTYNFHDITLGSTLFINQPLSTRLDGNLYVDYSPLIDGLVLEMDTQVDPASFRFTDFSESTSVSGFNGVLQIQNEDTLGTAPPLISANWAWRGSDYIVSWIKYPPDTLKLTLQICDKTNNVYVPGGKKIGDHWHFGLTLDSAETYVPTQKGFYLCGGYFWFNKAGTMSIPPGAGDIWRIASSGHKVPSEGNIYSFTAPTGVDADAGPAQPSLEYKLAQNYPNPFGAQTAIHYQIKSKCPVKLAVYNIAGQLVRTVVQETQNAGDYRVNWNGRDDYGRKAASGIYFYRLSANNISLVKKLTLIR